MKTHNINLQESLCFSVIMVHFPERKYDVFSLKTIDKFHIEQKHFIFQVIYLFFIKGVIIECCFQ